MPFLWVFNPALLAQGSWQAIVIVTITCVVAGALIGQMVIVAGKGVIGIVGAVGLLVGALMTGSATLWIGPESLLAPAPSGAGLIVLFWLRNGREKKALRLQKA